MNTPFNRLQQKLESGYELQLGLELLIFRKLYDEIGIDKSLYISSTSEASSMIKFSISKNDGLDLKSNSGIP